MQQQLQLPEGLRLRASAPKDGTFLKQLYASIRVNLQALGPAAESLIDMQYEAEVQGDRTQYPSACEFVIENLQEAIGQITLDAGQDQVRVIELAFLPDQRNRGWGKAVLRAVQCYAAKMQAVIELTVNQDNSLAKSLYLALGFSICATEAPNDHMHWRPDGTAFIWAPTSRHRSLVMPKLKRISPAAL